jgi:E1A/CREB-binding protein
MKRIQQQLLFLLHAQECRNGENSAEYAECNVPHCGTFRNVLDHIENCPVDGGGNACSFTHCSSSRRIIGHWKECELDDSLICLPLI